jgi:glutamate formiminotransferase
LVVLDAIRKEAAKYGVEASEGELIGLIPLKFLMKTAASALKLPSLDEEQVLEALVWRKS